MLRQQKYQKVARFFAATAETTPQDRARAVTRVCKMADKAKQTAAGIFSTASMQIVFANSRGLFAQYEQTRSEFSVTILEEHSSGWAKSNSPDIRNIDPDALAESASRKAAAFAQAARTSARALHDDPRAARRARSCRFSLLRFCRHGGARQTLLLHRPHGQETLRRKHHVVGRRVPSPANRRRRSTAKAFRGRKFCWSIAACRRIWSTRAPPPKK